jgi:hypothetical protein
MHERMRRHIPVFLVALGLFAVTANGASGTRFLFLQPDASPPAAAKPGWEKVELTSAGRDALPIPLAALTAAGGEDVADYGSFRIAYVPVGIVKAFEARLAAQGIRMRERDELDRIETPGASIDVRRGIDPSIHSGLVREYPPKSNGLYVAQFVGPAKSEWYKSLLDIGWTIVRYLPYDAYVLAGPPELAARTRQLPFVQFFDFFHPFEKASVRASDGEPKAFLFAMPSVVGTKEATDTIGKLALDGSVRVNTLASDTYVHASMKSSEAMELLSSALVISVSAEPPAGLSDERQALSVTSNVTADGSQPTTPPGYASWLASRCSLCTAANMPSSTWRVGTIDTGLDGGSSGAHHPDLAGRESWGATFAPLPGAPPDGCNNGCDGRLHGTMVAGIIGGNPTANTDPQGYFYGSGIAPMAGVFATKVVTTGGYFAPIDVTGWTQDAASAVTVESQSINFYASGGYYTEETRQYDVQARILPMLFTISTGDNNQNAHIFLTVPPATAKNVLSMGGVENFRQNQNDCNDSSSDGFRNILKIGSHGTNIPGYFKPDLVAPASLIVSTKSQWNPAVSHGYCWEDDPGANLYAMESGTSFAAPAAAGAAILVKRYLGASSPADVSPAGVKAVLIAGARSVRGGTDRSVTPNIPVGPIPNMQQGFGRLSLDNVLTGTAPPVLIDQSPGRHFITSGQARTTRLTVRDSSKPIVVALVWTDYPGTPSTTSNASVLVNDLDLTIFPIATPCTFRQGNYLAVSNESRGEESVSTPCGQAGTIDHVNNVEYARFFTDGFSQFDVRVGASVINGVGDPGYSMANNQDFALVVLNADLLNGGNIVPPQLTAARDSATAGTVHLSWTEPLNMIVDHYEVKRGSTLANLSTVYPNEHGTTKDDTGLQSGVHTWIYRVTAVGTSSTSDSAITIATTIKFDDDPIVPFVTPILAHHTEQLRRSIDAIRTAAGLAVTNWMDGTSFHGTIVKTQHVTQMQGQLDEALSQLNLVSAPYTPLTVHIKALDINELRAHVK